MGEKGEQTRLKRLREGVHPMWACHPHNSSCATPTPSATPTPGATPTSDALHSKDMAMETSDKSQCCDDSARVLTDGQSGLVVSSQDRAVRSDLGEGRDEDSGSDDQVGCEVNPVRDDLAKTVDESRLEPSCGDREASQQLEKPISGDTPRDDAGKLNCEGSRPSGSEDTEGVAARGGEQEVSELCLSCRVFLIVWRDRARVRKLLKSSQSRGGFHLEQAVSFHYLSEHVSAGNVPSDLESLIRLEVVRSEDVSLSGCVVRPVDERLLEKVKFPKVKFGCRVKVSEGEGSSPSLLVEMSPDVSVPDDLSFFKLFSESFRSVLGAMVRSQLVR
ncbi:uncharacterized protein LOC106011953 [Aplysia californica]|uniref:Uncharacterized protein LOC106011953 n=1 Tax=Aplysia californica TaxID=6500 RepID=A0ABM1A184_APLCA|nr:uncharacterized protein LOC106011953 [Aplysia californica]